jgi:hypothetical protein
MARRNSLQALEDALNKDTDLRNAFLKDPVRALRRGGVDLSNEEAASVRSQFAEMGLKRIPDLALRIRIRIRIKIGIGIVIG